MSNCYFKEEIAVAQSIYEANNQNNYFMKSILISITLHCDNSKEQNIQNTLNGEGVASLRCELQSERNTLASGMQMQITVLQGSH